MLRKILLTSLVLSNVLLSQVWSLQVQDPDFRTYFVERSSRQGLPDPALAVNVLVAGIIVGAGGAIAQAYIERFKIANEITVIDDQIEKTRAGNIASCKSLKALSAVPVPPALLTKIPDTNLGPYATDLKTYMTALVAAANTNSPACFA